MPSQQASPVHLSPIQQELLQRMVHRAKSEQQLVKRGHLILEAAQGTSNTKIAQHRQVDYETVRRWRGRWPAAESRVPGIETTGKPKIFEQAVQRALTRGKPSGGPPTLPFLDVIEIHVAFL